MTLPNHVFQRPARRTPGPGKIRERPGMTPRGRRSDDYLRLVHMRALRLLGLVLWAGVAFLLWRGP